MKSPPMLRILFLIAILSPLIPGRLSLGDEGEWHYASDNGFYAGLFLSYNEIGGGFKGSSVLVDREELILVPKVDSASGVGIVLGFQNSLTPIHSKVSAFELSYMQSSHDVSFQGNLKNTAVFSMAGLDYSARFFPDQALQPGLMIGVGMPVLKVRNYSIDIDENTSDATFSGAYARMGAGLSYYFTPRLALRGNVMYRWTSFSDVKGISRKEKLIDSKISGHGFSGAIMLTYNYFRLEHKPPRPSRRHKPAMTPRTPIR